MTKEDALVLRGPGKWCSLAVAALLCVEAAFSLALVRDWSVPKNWIGSGLALSASLLLAYATLSSKRWASSLNLAIGFLLLIRVVIGLLGSGVGLDLPLFVLAALSFYLLNRQVRAAEARAA
jgi:hypothetical protein